MKGFLNRLRGVERDIIQQPVEDEAGAPYYEAQKNEVEIFEAAYKKRLPVMLKGPTGFDKDAWPDMADLTWAAGIHSYYGTKPYYDPLA